MVVVTAVTVKVVVVVVVKVLVWVEAIVNMAAVVEVIVIDVLVDVGDIVMVLKFAFPVSYSVDVSSSGVAVDLFMDELTDVTIAALAGIGIDVLADVSANAFTVVMTALEFPVSTPLEEISR